MIARTRYTLMTAISEIGGFWALMYSLSAAIISMWTHNNVENFLVSKLFRVMQPETELELKERKGRGTANSSKYWENSNYMDHNKLLGLNQFVRKYVHGLGFTNSCKRTRDEKAFFYGR
jgi:hypothetical protein